MSSNGKHNGAEPPESLGVLGDGALHPGKYNVALVRRAIRNRWPIRAEIRQRIVEQMVGIIEDSYEERNVIAASRVLVAADRVNLAATELTTPKTIQHQHSGSIGLIALREELLNDPDLIDFRRRQALECDTDPGAVCEVRQPGQVENGKAPGAVGPEANGHSNGKVH